MNPVVAVLKKVERVWLGWSSAKQIALCIVTLLTIVVVVILWLLFGWYPGPSTGGVVIDRSTGRPVAHAYVVVSITSTRPSFGGYHTGCSRGSGVVVTDEHGRFDYSVSMSETINRPYTGSLTINLSVYHPDYAMPAPFFPDHKQFPEAWAVPSRNTQMRIEVVPKSDAAADRYIEIRGAGGTGCLGYGTYNPAPLYRLLYRESWELICGPSSDPAHLDMVLFLDAQRSLEDYLSGLEQPFPLPDQGYYEASWRRDFVGTTLLGNYPWSPSQPGHGRAFTAQERGVVCDFYAPPAEQVLKKRKPT